MLGGSCLIPFVKLSGCQVSALAEVSEANSVPFKSSRNVASKYPKIKMIVSRSGPLVRVERQGQVNYSLLAAQPSIETTSVFNMTRA